MENEQQNVEDHKLALTIEEYYLNLRIINNFRFTNREIDILASLLGGKSSKKIASLLSISPKTAEIHLRNIMLRIGCNSREALIEFTEKSDKFLLIKEYYSFLLIKTTFESELKKFLPSAKKNNVNCFLFYYKKPRAKDLFVEELEKHLTIAGIKTYSKVWEKNKTKNFLTDQLAVREINCIIYILSNDLIERSQAVGSNIIEDAVNSIPIINGSKIPVIFLLLNNTNFVLPELNQKSIDFTCINLTTLGNYYFLVFDLLKKILPNSNVCTDTVEFKKRYQLCNNYSFVQQDTEGQNKKNKQYYRTKFFSRKNLFLKSSGFIFFLLLFVVSLLIFGSNITNKNINNSQNILSGSQKNTAIFNLPPRNNNFVGRKAILLQIDKQLNNRNFGIITQAISGLGGVGKTQLATEFAYLAAKNKNYSVIFWIPAETTTAIHNAYQEIAKYLHLDVKGLELDDIQTILYNKLATTYQNTKILFIFDNVPSYEDVNNYLMKIHKQLSPYITSNILITSRSQNLPETPLILDIFTPEEASSFVKKQLSQEKTSSINILTKALNYFPLALGQATAYIKGHTNIDDYMELYTIKQKEYLDQFPDDKNQYNESLWKTWAIAINKLSNTAREILFTSAYLEPDNIPLILFEHLTTEERVNSIEELRKHSFITLIDNNKSFKIHRLLQEVIRLSVKHNSEKSGKLSLQHDLLKTDSYWLIKAMDLLKTKFDFVYLQPDQWKYWEKYLSQVKTVANHAISTTETLQEGLRLYIKYAMFLNYVKYDGKHAISPWLQISSLIQKYYNGQISKFILANLNIHMACAQTRLGKFQEAQKLLNDNVIPTYKQFPRIIQQEEQKLLDLLRIIPFKNNVNIQTKQKCDLNFALLILGNAQYKLGFMQEALATYIKARDVFIPGEIDDISRHYKADALGIVGRVYTYAGQLIEAESILKEAKKEVDDLYTNHTRKANVYANMALLMYHIGQFKEAATLLDKVSEIRLINFSANHIQHADTYIKLGFINYMLGNIIAAEQNFMHATAIYKLYHNNNYGWDLFVNLGFWKIYENLGKYNKAIECMSTALKIAKLNYKENITSMMSFQLTQAEVWHELNKHTELSYWKQALKVTQQLFGKDHYQAARYHYMLGQALKYEHKLQKANFHYKQALTILNVNVQKIKHLALKQFYYKNIQTAQSKLNEKQKLY
jgi:DNA-binding CsgD family transcriptional regulator